MKYIIDVIDDIRDSINNAQDYSLLAMLLKEDGVDNFLNAGEKVINSFYIDHERRQLQLGFLDQGADTKELLASINALDMDAMMYEVVVKISEQYPLMDVIGFGQNDDKKCYVFFVMA